MFDYFVFKFSVNKLNPTIGLIIQNSVSPTFEVSISYNNNFHPCLNISYSNCSSFGDSIVGLNAKSEWTNGRPGLDATDQSVVEFGFSCSDTDRRRSLKPDVNGVTESNNQTRMSIGSITLLWIKSVNCQQL